MNTTLNLFISNLTIIIGTIFVWIAIWNLVDKYIRDNTINNFILLGIGLIPLVYFKAYNCA